MYAVSMNGLKAGDIIFTKGHTVRSTGIKISTWCPYSHVMIYIGDGLIVHSDGYGVREEHIHHMRFQNKNAILVKRCKVDLTQEQVVRLRQYAMKCVGMDYASIKEVLKCSKLGKISNFLDGQEQFQFNNLTNRQFCSRLVAMSYYAARIELTKNPLFSTPGEIYRSSILKEIPHIELGLSKLSFPEDEWRSKRTNSLKDTLSSLRGKTGIDFQSLPQVTYAVFHDKSLDDVVSSTMLKEGYFDQWKIGFWDIMILFGPQNVRSAETLPVINGRSIPYKEFAHHADSNRELFLSEGKKILSLTREFGEHSKMHNAEGLTYTKLSLRQLERQALMCACNVISLSSTIRIIQDRENIFGD